MQLKFSYFFIIDIWYISIFPSILISSSKIQGGGRQRPRFPSCGDAHVYRRVSSTKEIGLSHGNLKLIGFLIRMNYSMFKTTLWDFICFIHTKYLILPILLVLMAHSLRNTDYTNISNCYSDSKLKWHRMTPAISWSDLGSYSTGHLKQNTCM
jgi:hypothetical protein